MRQFCAKPMTLRRPQPDSSKRAEAATGEALASFAQAYFTGEVRPEVDETRRVTAGHFGVHLAVWTPRTRWDGGGAPTHVLMMDGVARLVEGTGIVPLAGQGRMHKRYLLSSVE